MAIPQNCQDDAKERELGRSFMPRFDADGLIPCIAMRVLDRQVLMVAYMNEAALHKTLQTGDMWYWSRSRKTLWRKGETSGQIQTLLEMHVDCDQDTLLAYVSVGGDGRACHTGNDSCFYRRIDRSNPLQLLFGKSDYA